ncbi:MAG: nucleotidyltransferase family protein, partial [Anaerolineae bacterium]
MLLKGAALANTLYPTPALRPLSDIDLLIPRQHLEPAVQAVKSLGYRQPYPEMTAVNLPIYRKLTRILNAIRNPQSEISSLKSEIRVANGAEELGSRGAGVQG